MRTPNRCGSSRGLLEDVVEQSGGDDSVWLVVASQQPSTRRATRRPAVARGRAGPRRGRRRLRRARYATTPATSVRSPSRCGLLRSHRSAAVRPPSPPRRRDRQMLLWWTRRRWATDRRPRRAGVRLRPSARPRQRRGRRGRCRCRGRRWPATTRGRRRRSKSGAPTAPRLPRAIAMTRPNVLPASSEMPPESWMIPRIIRTQPRAATEV